MNDREISDMYFLEKEHAWFRAKRNLILKMYGAYNGKTPILDVGCGTGMTLKMFEKNKHGDVSFGIDVSSKAVRFCKNRKLKNVRVGNIEKLPYENNKFHTVIASDILEHVNDITAIKEVNRVLANKGLFIITVPAFNFLWSKGDDVLLHKRRYTKKELEKKLINNGFIIKKISYWNSFLLPLTYIYKIISPHSFVKKLNKFSNIVSFKILSIENFLIKYINFPMGVSVVCIAQKINRK